MTTDGLPGEVEVALILAACDRLLGEIGRRQHLFGWLRSPDAGPGEWLPVDAYYPGNKIVVVCSRSPHESVYAELVPGHGLRLLRVDPDVLGAGIDGVTPTLERLIARLGPVTRPTGETRQAPEHHESAVARAFATATQPSERPRAAARRRPAAEHAEQFVAAGVVVGVLLVAILCAEVYLAEVVISAGHIVLAFGIALDVCARALGAVGAHRAHEDGWLWRSVIGGSPFVAGFALFQRSGPVSVDPAPLAGLIAALAMLLVVLALVGMVLGI